MYGSNGVALRKNVHLSLLCYGVAFKAYFPQNFLNFDQKESSNNFPVETINFSVTR